MALGAEAAARLRRALLAQVADEPLSVETRALLLAPATELFGDPGVPGGAVVRNRPARLLAAVGDAGGDTLLAAADGIESEDHHWDLVAPIGELERLSRVLPAWRPEPALVFDLPPAALAGGGAGESVPTRPETGAALAGSAADGARVASLNQARPGLLDHLRGDFALEIGEAVGRVPMTAAFVDGRPVSFCFSYLETETLWDVAIGTVEGYRRRGLAAASARSLIDLQLGRGKKPVWSAMESNAASRRLAARLGFRPRGRLAVLEKVARPQKRNPRVTQMC